MCPTQERVVSNDLVTNHMVVCVDKRPHPIDGLKGIDGDGIEWRCGLRDMKTSNVDHTERCHEILEETIVNMTNAFGYVGG